MKGHQPINIGSQKLLNQATSNVGPWAEDHSFFFFFFDPWSTLIETPGETHGALMCSFGHQTFIIQLSLAPYGLPENN